MMKKIVYIIGFLLCFSCNQFSPKSENAPSVKDIEKEEFKVEENPVLEDSDDAKSEADFSLSYLSAEVEEKLQANYEAKILAIQHPEFKEAIKEQLAGSDKFRFTLSDSIKTIEITDVNFLGVMTKHNDSLFTQKFSYTSIINTTHKQKDSVLVVMKRSMIMIDNQLEMSTSFSFESLDR